MDSVHYDELCRRYIAEKFGIPLEAVTSRRERNPQREGEAGFSHEIELWWEKADDVVRYVNIANAKWRATDKVLARSGDHRAGAFVEVQVPERVYVRDLVATDLELLATMLGFSPSRGLFFKIPEGVFVPSLVFRDQITPLAPRASRLRSSAVRRFRPQGPRTRRSSR